MVPLSPEPRLEWHRPYSPGRATSRGRKPRQLPARAVRGTCRPGADPPQMFLPCPRTNGLAAGVRYRIAVQFERIGVGEPGSVKAGWSVRIAYDLAAGQDARHQNRPRVVAQILGLIGPSGDEGTEIQARSDQVLAQIQRGEAVRRIPASPSVLREARIERVRPGGIPDSPPHMCVRNRLVQQLHGQPCACSNRNMARQAESNPCVSPRASKSISDAPSSTRMGLRTTAGIRSRLR